MRSNDWGSPMALILSGFGEVAIIKIHPMPVTAVKYTNDLPRTDWLIPCLLTSKISDRAGECCWWNQWSRPTCSSSLGRMEGSGADRDENLAEKNWWKVSNKSQERKKTRLTSIGVCSIPGCVGSYEAGGFKENYCGESLLEKLGKLTLGLLCDHAKIKIRFLDTFGRRVWRNKFFAIENGLWWYSFVCCEFEICCGARILVFILKKSVLIA